jgi:iron(III) transport system substrate-binding protein
MAASPSGSSSASASAVSSADAQAAIDAVCQKGILEGAVTVWDDIDPDLFAKEMAPFVQKYPGIKVTQTSIRPTDSVPRVITDVTAGKTPETDFVQGEASLLDPLVQRGLIDTSFDWVAMGQPSDEVLNGMLRHYRTFRGLGYNVNSVQKSELPDTWDALIDAKWSGQVMVDPRGYTFQDLAVAWGEQKTLDYVNRLKATVHPIVLKGITDDEVAIASGQAKLNTNIRDAETAEQQSKGAPVDIKYLDYVIVDDSYNAVVKGSAHPNASACLIAWMNSEDGLKLQYDNEFKHNEDTLSAVPANAQLVNVDTPEKASLDSKVAAEVAKIWANK